MRGSAVLILTCTAAWGQAPTSDTDFKIKLDEQTLREHRLGCDGPALLSFFKSRTLSKQEQAELGDVVRMLGDPSYQVREKAQKDLSKRGEAARAALFKALESPDKEVVRRAEVCLRRLKESGEAVVGCAAARLLAERKPDGAVEVLLNYLPFATDADVVEELHDSLAVVAVRQGKPDVVLLEAVKDPLPCKRGAAAAALLRHPLPELHEKLRPLLKDPVPCVRLQVARGFVLARDKSAVPVLIALLTELQGEEACQAEEMLLRIAGEYGPGVYLDAKVPAAKVQAAWGDWWSKGLTNIDLSRLAEPMAGYVLITEMDSPKKGAPGAFGLGGRVFELRPGNKLHWEITGLRHPADAQVIGRDRVLICEYLNRRVTERDFKGTVLWEYQEDMPISAQRLTNGHTFIVTRRKLVIVDRDRREIFSHLPPVPSIAAGARGRDGQMAIVTSGGVCQRIDAKGTVVKQFHVGRVYTMGGNVELLPGGRVLIPEWGEGRVSEYDADGKSVWSVAVQSPTSAVRLPTGTTLVVSMGTQRVVEFNREGQAIWEYRSDGRPWRARKR